MASQLRPACLLMLLLAALTSVASAATLLRPATYSATYTVAKGKTMYLAGTYKFTKLVIEAGGVLTCGPGRGPPPAITLSAISIDVKGSFSCGTVAAPYTGKVSITMYGSGAEGTKIIDVSGKISLIGTPRSSWTSISSTVMKGGNSFSTAQAVDWKVGERLVVTSSSFDMNEAEEVVIATVAANPSGGSLITTTTAFKNTHYGDLQSYSSPKGSTWELDERAQVALLDRNIVFQGDAPSLGGNGAIITIRKGGHGWAKDVKFQRVGQKGRLGTYPWHWHMLGVRTGDFIKNCVIMQSTNRCVTVHGTDGVTVERNVCYDNIGHAYFIEDGCEENNNFLYNLGLTTRLPASKAAGAIDTDFTHLSTFWITNPKNNFVGNVAAGSAFAGYWFMLPSSPTRECITEPAAAKLKPGLAPNKQPLGRFDDNVAHSNVVGVGIEGGIVNSARAPTSGQATFWDPAVFPIFRNMTVCKNTQGQKSLWVTMFKTIYFDGCKLADNGGSTLFSGAQITRNTLYVGQSANIYPRPITSNMLGSAFYDGPAGMVDTHFAGFPQWYQYPLPLTGAAIKSWNFFMNGVTFDQSPVSPTSSIKQPEFPKSVFTKNFTPRGANFSQPQFFCQGIIDQTGSMTGTPNTIMMARLNPAGVSAGSFMDEDFNVKVPACTFNAVLGFYVCPGTMSWATLVIMHRFTGNTHIVDVTRNDGKRASIDSAGRPHYFWNALLGSSYTVNYRNQQSLTFAGGVPVAFEMYMRNVDPGVQMEVALTGLPVSANWKWAVTECFTHKKLVKPTAVGTVKFTLVAAKLAGSVAGPYPNQKVGGVRVKVCAHPTGVCDC